MPKLSPQTLDDRKWARAEAFVAATNEYTKTLAETGPYSKQTLEAFRHMKYCQRQYQKVRYT